MLSAQQLQKLADDYTIEGKRHVDSCRDWLADLPQPGKARRRGRGAGRLPEEFGPLSEACTERAYLIAEEQGNGDYARVLEQAKALLGSSGFQCEPGDLAALCDELMRRTILLTCYESEKYAGNVEGLYHDCLKGIEAKVSALENP